MRRCAFFGVRAFPAAFFFWGTLFPAHSEKQRKKANESGGKAAALQKDKTGVRSKVDSVGGEHDGIFAN